MENEVKYHSTFGQVQIVSTDYKFTTIIIVATGEQKKLVNQYAKLTDAPVEVVKVKKVKPFQRELTEEEKERVAISVDRQMREEIFIAGLSREARLEYRANKSRRIHLG